MEKLTSEALTIFKSNMTQASPIRTLRRENQQLIYYLKTTRQIAQFSQKNNSVQAVHSKVH
jgi:hypothetical protein